MYNRVILMGRLTHDPELKTTQSGISLVRFRIAIDRPYKKDGEGGADFITCVAWRQTAEFVCKYFSKGKAIHLEGRFQNADYEDKNGTKHYAMEVQVDNVCFCGGKQEGNATTPQQYETPYPQRPPRSPQASGQDTPMYEPEDLSLAEFEVISDGEVPF